MPNELPVSLRDIAKLQRGVISRRQALSAGLSKDVIESRIDRGRWQRLHTGVYAVFTGLPGREATLWAALLRVGQGAALSYQTAAELDGLLDKPASVIHVTVPASRRVSMPRGIIVHARLGADEAVHPVRLPPRTRSKRPFSTLVTPVQASSARSAGLPQRSDAGSPLRNSSAKPSTDAVGFDGARTSSRCFSPAWQGFTQ